MIKLNEVESSMISAIGYDEKQQHLYVQFKTGDIYRYKEVPIGIYQKLSVAPSKGQFLSAFVVKAGYEYEKLGNTFDQQLPKVEEVTGEFKKKVLQSLVEAGLAKWEMDEQGNPRIVLTGEAVKEALS